MASNGRSSFSLVLILLGLYLFNVISTIGQDSAQSLLTKVRTLRNQALSEDDLVKSENLLSQAVDLTSSLIDVNDEKGLDKEDRISRGSLHADVLHEYGKALASQKKFEQALVVMIESKDLTLKIFGKQHPSYGLTLRSIAQVYASLYHYEAAIEAYVELMTLIKRGLGVEHEAYSKLVFVVAETYLASQDFLKTIEFINTNLAELTSNNLASLELPNIADLYMIKSMALARIGRDKDTAMASAEKALKGFQLRNGERSMDVAMAFNNIAGIHTMFGSPSDGLPYLKDALEIAIEHHGLIIKGHPLVLAASKHVKDLEKLVDQKDEL